MFDWIGRLFGAGLSGLADLANQVRKAITDLINLLIGQFVGWVTAALYMLQAAANFVVALSAMISSLARFAGRAVVVYLPNAIAKATDDAFHWTEKRYSDAVNWTEKRWTELTQWAAQALADLRNWAVGQVASIITTLNNAITLLNDVAKRVYALLTNPRALADWVAGELVGALYRWALGAAEALGRLFFRFAVSAAIRAADVLEQVIADIFL